MSQSEEEKPKLIIDEDWKTQVQRERETLLKQSPGSGEMASSESDTGDSELSQTDNDATAHTPASSESTESRSDEDDLPPPPPASFPFLVSMLGTQALAAMGQLGNEHGAPPPRLDYAKHYIDLLGLLEEKTKGNLTTEEYDLLADWLHQLRMGFISMSKRMG
ncbi:MAG: DUF1844 domain-containing protein [Pirellulaceae bacterium]|nr:DUF1844 domain-containing protein [Pirellulaceae bacterium]